MAMAAKLKMMRTEDHGNIDVIPDEILVIIVQKLSFWDRLRSWKVCQRWRRLIHELGLDPRHEPPWLMDNPATSTTPTLNVHEPALHHRPPDVIRLDKIIACASDRDHGRATRALVHYSSFGWLLCSRIGYVGDGMPTLPCSVHRWFLYCPFFEEKIINLPYNPASTLNLVACFSGLPTGPSCTVFVAYGYGFAVDEIRVLWHHLQGSHSLENGWSMHSVKLDLLYSNSKIYAALAWEGGLYFVLHRNLWFFNIQDCSWNMVSTSKSVLPQFRSRSREKPKPAQLVRSYNGQLLCVCNAVATPGFKVLRFDRLRKVWMNEKLDDQVVFIDYNGNSAISIPAIGVNSALAGRIYYHPWRTKAQRRKNIADRVAYFSLATGTTHEESHLFMSCSHSKIWVVPPYCRPLDSTYLGV